MNALPRILALAAAWALPIAAPGCDAPDAPPRSRITLTDDAGRPVALPRPATRVFSAVPALTETIEALGAADVLIARTRFDRAPGLAHLPVLGGSLDPGVERIASLRPDLVVAWWGAGPSEAPRQLESLGIPVYHAQVESIDDLRRHVRRLGALLGRAEAAEALRAHIDEGLRDVAASVAGRPRVGVYYALWPYPPATVGPGSFVDEIIARAGGRNVFHDAHGAWPGVSLEALVQRAPEALVIPVEGGGKAEPAWLGEPGWRDLPAVASGRILVVDADLFNRPGPRVVEAARELARFLHGVDP